ncbi:hypothetical protein A5320_09040 [Rheinheimera sp. SA_1]|nr:hypothetical protein A5320_09040 [Rheinheimera sp. SA_1]
MAALHPRYWSVPAENPVELVILLLTQWRHLLQSALLYCSGLVLLSALLLPQAFAAETSSARMLPMLHFSSTAEEQQLSRYGGVGTIGEDPFGQLWLASRNGLLYYDGQQIRRLSAQNSGLANNLITDLDTQDPEALWLLTYNLQLQQMRYADQQFRTLDLSTQLITGSFNVARLFGTRDRIWLLGGHRLRYVDRATMQLKEIGPSLAAVVNRYARVSHTDEAAPDLWMLTDQGQLYHWAEQQQQLSPVLQLPTAEPAEAMLAVDDILYVLQHKKLYQLDPAQRTWQLLLDTQTLDASAHPFYLLYHQQQLWLSGPDTGLIRYQLTSGISHRFVNVPGLTHGLPDNHTSALFIDSLQNLWVGTVNSGLSRVALRHLDAQSFGLANPGLGAQAIRPLLALQDQSWLLADHQYRLWHWHPDQDKLKAFPEEVQAYAARQLNDGSLLLFGNAGFYQSDPDWQQFRWQPLAALQDKTFATITASHVDQQQQLLYLATYYGLLQVNLQNGEQRQFSQPQLKNQLVTIVNMATRDDGKLWLLTRAEGLLLLDPKTDSWQQFSLSEFPGQAYFDLKTDSQQRLWIASDQGAFRLQLINGQFQLDSPVLGLTADSNEILAVHLSADGQIWLNNSDQIMVYQPEQWQGSFVAAYQGLQLPLPAKQLLSNQQYLISGSANGLNLLPLQLAKQQQPVLIQLRFSQLQTFRRQINLSQQGSPAVVALDYEERQFRLQLQGFSSGDLSTLRYQLKVPELQQDWGPATDQALFDLYNLPSGLHQLQIRWLGPDQQPSAQVLTLQLAIAPPWWRSNLAYGAYLLLLLILGGMAGLDLRHRQQLKARHLAQLAEKEQQLRLALWGSGDELWDWHLAEQRMQRQNCLPQLNSPAQTCPFLLEQQLLLVHPDDRAQVKTGVMQHLAGTSDYYQASYRLKIGPEQWLWVLDRGKITERDQQQRPLRFSGTLQVIDELKKVEQQLLQLNNELEQLVQCRTGELAQSNQQLLATIEQLTNTRNELIEVEKMTSLGAMVAGLAHELNTPLGVVITSVSSVEDMVLQQQKLKSAQQLSAQFFDDSQQQILTGCSLAMLNLQRVNLLIVAFKKLAVNITGEHLAWVKPAEIWHSQLHLLKDALAQRQFQIDAEIVGELQIETYASAFTEILHELLLNSVHHAKVDGAARIFLRISLQGDQLHLHYADNGVPINRALRGQIFDPFITSSRQHGRVGLGLSLLFNLVTQLLHGTIRYQTDEVSGWFDISFCCRLHRSHPEPLVSQSFPTVSKVLDK